MPSASASASPRSRRSIAPSASAPSWRTWSSTPRPRIPDYDDRSITENTRACYPIEHIDGAIDPLRGRPSPPHHLPDLRRVRRPAARQPPDPRPGDVPLPQRLHRQGRRDRGRRVGAPGHLLGLLRRGVPGAAPGPICRDARRADRAAWSPARGWSTPAGPAGLTASARGSSWAIPARSSTRSTTGRSRSRRPERTRSSACTCRPHAPAFPPRC